MVILRDYILDKRCPINIGMGLQNHLL